MKYGLASDQYPAQILVAFTKQLFCDLCSHGLSKARQRSPTTLHALPPGETRSRDPLSLSLNIGEMNMSCCIHPRRGTWSHLHPSPHLDYPAPTKTARTTIGKTIRTSATTGEKNTHHPIQSHEARAPMRPYSPPSPCRFTHTQVTLAATPPFMSAPAHPLPDSDRYSE